MIRFLPLDVAFYPGTYSIRSFYTGCYKQIDKTFVLVVVLRRYKASVIMRDKGWQFIQAKLTFRKFTFYSETI